MSDEDDEVEHFLTKPQRLGTAKMRPNKTTEAFQPSTIEEEDLDDDPLDNEVDWFDRLGAGGLAMSACAAAVLSVFVMVVVNQIAASQHGNAGVPSAQEATFEPPETPIARVNTSVAPDARLINAQPFDNTKAQSVMAVIVIDDGRDSHAADRALEWSIPLTFAVPADFDDSPFRVKQMRRKGREVLALVPMGYGEDLAQHPNVIARHLSDTELLRRLRWHVARTGDVVGVLDMDGGDVLRDVHAMGIVARELKDTGALFIHSKTTKDSIAGKRVRAAGVPTGQRTARIDYEDTVDQAFEVLLDAEKYALEWGTAIVLVEAGATSMNALSDWLNTHNPAVAIAPVSHVVGRLRRGGI